MRLLLIEDDRGIARALNETLSAHYHIDTAHTGFGGLELANGTDYGCILLDLNLPDISGLRVCQLLREQGCPVPIIIITGESQVLSKIKLLDAGADDYLTKPFSLGELKARLRVLERRVRKPKTAEIQLQIGDVIIDSARHVVEREGRQVTLRRKEFALLECLAKHAGTVVSRTTLGEYAWNQPDFPWANTIDVHIKLLRDKFDRPFDTSLIRTVHGLGYTYHLEPVGKN